MLQLTQSLSDLNDYLGPSQACIKPVDAPVNEPNGAEATEIMVDDGTYYEAASGGRARTQLETAQISLNDCLACSGCVTTAETVLIGMQSIDEVKRELAEPNGRTFTAMLSPQSLASLATRYAYASVSKTPLPLPLLLHRIRAALVRLGFAYVSDTTFARHLALREHTREFFERRTARDTQAPADIPRLPMLASACPGWVCYAEKAHSELLPYVAATKSPQQVGGLLAKRGQGTAHASTYHVSVMPCYDKKLEASRPDFVDAHGEKEVDCVLTTGELHDLLLESAFDPYAQVPSEPEEALTLLQEPGSSSGGYLFAILYAVWDEWQAAHPSLPSPTLDLRVIRSADYTEYVLRSDDTVVFKGAQCYGFRNLQNLVRKLQRETGTRGGGSARGRGRGMVRKGAPSDVSTPYDYIEVMACPGGCVNGGGQMRPPAGSIEEEHVEEDSPVQGWQGTDKGWVQQVEDTYWIDPGRRAAASVKTAPEHQAEEPVRVLQDALHGPLRAWLTAMDAEAAKTEETLGIVGTALFRTQYHGVEQQTNGLAVQW